MKIIKSKGFKDFILSFIVYFLVQIKFVNDSWYPTDECDIYVIGKGIARGGVLYKNLTSQHMPISYYISAFFELLGIKTVANQRLAFYTFFAIVWAAIFIRYSKFVNKKGLFFAPILFCFMQPLIENGTVILSEHIAGLGAVIIFLEFILFSKNKKLSVSACIMISLSIVLMFGCVFWLAYAIFFIAVGVFAIEIREYIKNKISLKKWSAILLKRYLSLAIVIVIPWICLIIYYAYNDCLRDFIFGAYTQNRTYYSEYQQVGGNILSPFLQPLDVFFSYIKSNATVGLLGYNVIVQWVYIICFIVFVYDLWIEKKKIESITTIFFMFSLGIRSIFSYHGMQCVEVLTLIGSLVIFEKIIGVKEKFTNYTYKKQIIIVGLFILLSCGYFSDISEILSIKINVYSYDEDAEILKEITKEDEGIGTFCFANATMMKSDRFPIMGYPATPWTWEAYRDRFFYKDILNPPRVVLYDDTHGVVEQLQTVYAAELSSLISTDYKRIGDSRVYVRDDYYNELDITRLLELCDGE